MMLFTEITHIWHQTKNFKFKPKAKDDLGCIINLLDNIQEIPGYNSGIIRSDSVGVNVKMSLDFQRLNFLQSYDILFKYTSNQMYST